MNEYERPNDSSLSTADLVNRPAGTGAEGRTDEDEQIIQSRPAGMPTTERPVSTPLFAEQETREMRSRWDTVQTSFVDEPRQSVQQADSLVAEAMQRLAIIFSEERNKLEQHWDRGDEVSTEDLRIALQRYRSFFDRLLSV